MFCSETTRRLRLPVYAATDELLTDALRLHSSTDKIAGHPQFARLAAISFHTLAQGLTLALRLLASKTDLQIYLPGRLEYSRCRGVQGAHKKAQHCLRSQETSLLL